MTLLVGTNNVINNLGGNLTVESRVSDKQCGDIGHPVQYDSGQSQWYISVATGASDNDLYPTINALGAGTLGDATSRTFISRLSDTRTLDDRLYKVRYVIPAWFWYYIKLDHLDRTTFSNNQMT